MRERIQSILDYLGHDLVERDEALKIALLAVFSGENIVFLGPPGTGKSLMARRIASVLDTGTRNEEYFEYLLTKFSSPDELFGPLSIAELKADRFWRKTEKYLPAAKLAFLDEIFKANSSILNALLTILNERIYHNGSESLEVPMRSLIAASNEVPADQDELAALYDRFLLRGFVDYVSHSNLSSLFVESVSLPRPNALTTEELTAVEQGASRILIPKTVEAAVTQIWQAHKDAFKEDRRENLSDRRLKKIIHLLRISAHTNGRKEVDLSDVFLLKNCLWNHPENANRARTLVIETLQRLTHLESSDVVERASESGGTSGLTGFAFSDTPKPGEMSAIVRGVRGRGTKNDPLLMESVADLLELENSEVGLQGYYFRQISDIDCDQAEEWPEFGFKGHYNGNGFEIKGSSKSFFNNIQEDSSITRLRLSGIALARSITGSDVSLCSCDKDLIIDGATKSTFTAVKTEGSLLGYNVNVRPPHYRAERPTTMFGPSHAVIGCTIDRCQAGYFIAPYAENCHLTDSISLHLGNSNYTYDGGLVLGARNSSISRCMVAEASGFGGIFPGFGGVLPGFDVSGGIAGTSENSEIQGCVLAHGSSHPNKRIVGNNARETKLTDNASIASHPGHDDPCGNDGMTIDDKFFKQQFFESKLGWDFDKTWRWDNRNDRPALKNIGCDAGRPDSDEPKIDFLAQKISDNLWL